MRVSTFTRPFMLTAYRPVNGFVTQITIAWRVSITYRTIVYKTNIHHRLEDTILDTLGLVQFLDLAKEMIIQLFRYLRLCRFVEVGLISFGSGRQECELRN